ncbi:uveal autoantigen with coiled-coil domains and ankyrin repeats-like isoform X2 [Rhinatrema bivittatum]|uniref:uveal autoantigen with coiled-coil domains and ankyrin repeats-like isoform X2 n=1 Tax=Rhinatrema bivittatum TaxID=194408 RepID=UPI00112BC8D9|nr:uveal autoantigen with coiled-coil domains and ankyrin repeats-like isoform X2 [Rhinatrema bivittatum]
MTQFDRKSKLGVSQRYRIMIQSNSMSMNNSDAKEYAEFLQQQERKLGPDGFLDSKKYTNSYVIKSGVIRSKSLPILNGKHQQTSVDFSTKKPNNLKDQDQRIKFIEHKHEERALRRFQGDVQRQKRVLQRMITDYENVARKKILDDEREMNDLQHQQENNKQQFYHEQEYVRKDNILQHRQDIQSARDHQQKHTRTLTQLELRYSQVFLEMQKRHAEIERLHQEYGGKLKQKENEEALLRKELAELAHSANVEEQKENNFKNDLKRYECIQEKQHQKSTFESKQMHIGQQVKALEARKQTLNADLAMMKGYLQERNARESRKIVDITNQLIKNADIQREITQENANLRSQTIKRTLKTSSTEKVAHLQYVAKERAETSPFEIGFSAQKEERKQALEKSISHFQKVVSSAQKAEKSIFRDMHSCGYLWRKQDKHIHHLQEQLTKLRKENTAQMRKTISEANMKERDLQWQINKELAELKKYQNQTNTSYGKLLKHRALLQEDRHKLTETEKQYARLCNIKERNQAVQQTTAS